MLVSSPTCNDHTPKGTSPQQRTVVNVQSCNPLEELTINNNNNNDNNKLAFKNMNLSFFLGVARWDTVPEGLTKSRISAPLYV